MMDEDMLTDGRSVGLDVGQPLTPICCASARSASSCA
jgi:hypothetical protein